MNYAKLNYSAQKINEILKKADEMQPTPEIDLDIPICCVSRAVFNKAPGERVNSSLSLIEDGTPKMGQYVLVTNGVGYIESISSTSMSVRVVSAFRIKLNGSATSEQTFYAPVNSGKRGNILMANGSGNAPFWTDVSSLWDFKYSGYSDEYIEVDDRTPQLYDIMLEINGELMSVLVSSRPFWVTRLNNDQTYQYEDIVYNGRVIGRITLHIDSDTPLRISAGNAGLSDADIYIIQIFALPLTFYNPNGE